MQRIMLKNAVFLKDVSIRSKKKRLAVSFFALNLIASMVFMLILMLTNGNFANYSNVDIQSFSWIYDGFIIIECAMICIMAPMETGPAISNERERQTLDVLLTTNMSHFDIILGKYLSSALYMLLTLVSLLPFQAVVLIYGGISLGQLFAVMLSQIITIMYLSSFGIYFSTVIKKSSRASAVNLCVVFLIVAGSALLCVIARVIGELNISYNSSVHTSTYNIFNTGEWSYLLLYLNPATTVFDVLDKLVGFGGVFSSNYNGMATIIDETAHVLDPNNFFIKHWAPIGFTLQMVTACLMLRRSASKLNSVKRRKKHGKDKNN
ncbi:MAG: ABC transporter permease subunit [Lachnospiraceae bacterium]|nr:ABC transporter permease subunit [Lachnospiraceae bacterium]